MTSFIARRLVQFPLVLLFLISISFFLMRLAPGGPFSGERQIPPEIKRNIDRRYGFNRPVLFNFNYLRDLSGPARAHLAVLASAGASEKEKDAARSALSGFDSAAVGDLVGVVLDGPDELRGFAAASVLDVITWTLEDEYREILDEMADPESDASDVSMAEKRAESGGAAGIGVLAELLFAGTGGRQTEAARLLTLMTGRAGPVPPASDPEGRNRAVAGWRDWWETRGRSLTLPSAIPPPSDPAARDEALRKWRKWRDESGDRYRYSTMGGIAKIPDSQFLRYLWDLAQFDLGPSFKYKDKTVNDIIREHLPPSLLLGATTLIFALIMGLSTGIISGIRQNSLLDYASMSFAMIGLSVPLFVVGPLLVLVFALYLGIFNAAAWDTFPKDIILPAFTLSLTFTSRIARLTRAGMLEVINQDYIRVARAKGLRESVIIARHAMRGAMLPVVSFLGPGLALILTGSLVVEEIFGVPGIGKQFVKSALNRDYFVAMGVVILYGSLLIFFNLVVDVLYGFLDPRIRYT